MSRLLHRLGHSTAAHPWRTIAAWLVLAVAFAGLAASFGGTPHDNWDIPGAQAQHGIDQLREHTPGAGNASARVVVHDRSGAPVDATAVQSLTTRLQAMDHVVAVSAPRTSPDRDTALLTVQYDVPVTDDDLMGNLVPLEKAVGPTRSASGDHLQVELGGELPDTAAAPMQGQGELIGIVVALFILVLAFGSVVGAGLPVAVALLGLGVGSAGVSLLAATTDVSTSAPTVATMVGLGVGIDYALLLVTRHVEFLRARAGQARRGRSGGRHGRTVGGLRCGHRADLAARSASWPACRRTTPSATPPRSRSWLSQQRLSPWCPPCAAWPVSGCCLDGCAEAASAAGPP